MCVINEHSAVTIEKVIKAAAECPLMQQLKQAIENREEGDEQLKPFMSREIRHDLNITNGLICRGKRLIIPPSLQQEVVRICYEGHQGMTKAKALLRTFCWFPGIDSMVEQEVRKCIPYQATRPPTHPEPIKTNELPNGPWQFVEMDFQELYPNGEYIFIMIDRYSRWPEMKIFSKAPNSTTTIRAMKEIFANQGIPITCQSDNGPHSNHTNNRNSHAKRKIFLMAITIYFKNWP